MASQEQLLERIDRTLDRIDARLDQGERQWALSQRRWESSEQRWEKNERRWEQRDAELKDFLREMTTRHVEVTQEMIGSIHELGTEIVDQRSQLRANTEATWRMLERLGPDRPQG